MQKTVTQMAVAAAWKMLPLLLGAVGGWAATVFPTHVAAFCGGA